MIGAHCLSILEALWGCGVRDLVVSPGSRSTPLVLAALSSPLKLHSVLDERSAGFFALGIARRWNRPVALLCTSGSACAHYLPAMLEAKYSEHQLIAISADRPPALHDSDANQTISQEHILRSACGDAIMLPLPGTISPESLALRITRRIQSQLGPHHLNQPFEKPLEHKPLPWRNAQPLLRNQPQQVAAPSSIAACASAIVDSKRGVLLAGPLPHHVAAELAEFCGQSGLVMLAESTSNLQCIQESGPVPFPPILSAQHFADELEPDLLVRVGAQLSSPLLDNLWRSSSAPKFRLLASTLKSDAEVPGQEIVGDPVASANAISALLAPVRAQALAQKGDYRHRWQHASLQVGVALNSMALAPENQSSELVLLRECIRSLGELSSLTIGNSLPVRLIDWLDTTLPTCPVLHQRGTSGIDGLLAGAIGSSNNTVSALIVGDVSFAHDIASLRLASLVKGPLLVLLIDNGGGEIFSHLPVAKENLDDEVFALWRTPTTESLEALCNGFKVNYHRIESLIQVAPSIANARNYHGLSVLHLHASSGSAQASMASLCKRLRPEEPSCA